MFGRLLASSIAILLMVHLFINVGMTLGITPITGLPLPFMSYGGSFIITCFLMMGVVQSIHGQKRIHLVNIMTNSFWFCDLICRFQTLKPTWLENLDRVINF